MTQCPFSKPQDVNLLDPVAQENCFQAYDVLRNEAPVYFMPELGMYVLTKYEDIDYVLRNPELFINDYSDDAEHPLYDSKKAQSVYHDKGWERIMPLSTNLPEHRNYRSLVDPFLSAQAVRKREPLINDVVNELIDNWIDQPEIEFIQDFALPLPMAIIAEALGFPRVDVKQLKVWSDAWARPFGKGMNEQQEIQTAEEHVEFQHYIYETIQQKRRNPGDDVISHLAVADYDDPHTNSARKLTDAEIIGISDHLLTGGNETTTFALASGMWLLFRFPELWAEMKQDRKKVRVFVEEALRMESPTQGMHRYAAEDVEIRGVKIPKGSALHLRYGAANHDEEKFAEPTKPDLSRRAAASHFAFGSGEHVCPGAPLSRLEQQIAWNILLDRIDNPQPVSEKNDYTHAPGLWPRALKAVHMTFEKRD